MQIGIHFPNRPLPGSEIGQMVNLGGHDYLVYDAPPYGRDWGYWKRQIEILKSFDPSASIHLRMENRGNLPSFADAVAQIEAAWNEIGTLADTYRFGNEPDLERPGVGVAAYGTWMQGLHQRIPAGIPFYLPALSGAADGIWFDHCGQILQVAPTPPRSTERSWAGWDAHCYGSGGEFKGQLQKYRSRYAGPILISECNYGPGPGRELTKLWEEKELPLIQQLASQQGARGLIYFTWEWLTPDNSDWHANADLLHNSALRSQIADLNRYSLPAPSPDPVPITPEPEEPVNDGELERYARDIFRRYNIPFNRSAAIHKYWFDQLLEGRFLGYPMEMEHRSEDGRYVIQGFSNTILAWDSQTGEVSETLPPLDGSRSF